MFEKLVSFTKKVADLPDRPSLNPTALKSQFDAAPDEVRVYLNKLIDALKNTATGDSGAKNIGATSITGVTGSDIQTILENLTQTIIDIKKIPGWIGMPGFSGWGNYGDPFNSLQYCKDGLGFVHIRGLVKGGTQGSKITELPVGYRPLKSSSFACPHGSSGAVRIDVGHNGEVSLNASTPYADFVFLDGISFLAEQ